MRWLAGRILAPLLWTLNLVLLFVQLFALTVALPFEVVGSVLRFLGEAMHGLAARVLLGLEPWLPASSAEEETKGRAVMFARVRRRYAEGGLRASVSAAFLLVILALTWAWQRIASLINLFGRLSLRLARTVKTRLGSNRMRSEIQRFRTEARKVRKDVSDFSEEQQRSNALDQNKETVFLLITCGQAVRNFLLSDFFKLLRTRFNVVILTTYAYSEGFRKEYSLPGVHVLPWFGSFRTSAERMFQYYFMSRSRSRTHHSWLANLEARAKGDTNRGRFRRLILMRRFSDWLGGFIGPRGMQGLYASYFMAYLPKSLFTFLFSTYQPAVVISTTAHHVEAWPLTFFARRYGAKTVGNILSWDNPTTKPIMDVACDYYTVWSEEMKGDLAYQFPHIQTEVIITGCPLFDVYYQRPFAKPRDEFLAEVGLPLDKPYILYATNTPAAMPDECQVIEQYWDALNRSPIAGKVAMLVRLHPKETTEKYRSLFGLENLVVTRAAEPHWDQSDRWLPNAEDMSLLLNSMMHAAVSVNVASTMSLESFALELPTINIAFKSSDDIKDHGSMWSFDMYHFSEHYHAIVENGSVDLARSVGELVGYTISALDEPDRHKKEMHQTLTQKAAYCDGTSGRRFFEVIEGIAVLGASRRPTDSTPNNAMPNLARAHVAEAAE